jgi:DNA (cytosine-5)-methyltransferase 1
VVSAVNVLSLFSGVGMGDLAAERVGLPVVAMAEIDTQARGVLRHRFPGVPIFDDVKEVTGDAARSAGFAGPAGGVVVAGSPCQDLSVAGKRAGLDGARSGLWWEVVRICDETQAEWLVWENVPGALSSNGGRDFGTVLGSLVDLGMGFAWRVLDAQHFGVPQRRRRIFLVARRASDGFDCAEVLSVGEGVRRHPAARVPSRAGAAPDVAVGAGSGGVDLFGQTGFARYQRGGVKPLSATDPKRPEDNIVVGNWPAEDTVGTLTADTHPGAYTGQDAHTGRLVAATLQGGGCHTDVERLRQRH